MLDSHCQNDKYGSIKQKMGIETYLTIQLQKFARQTIRILSAVLRQPLHGTFVETYQQVELLTPHTLRLTL